MGRLRSLRSIGPEWSPRGIASLFKGVALELGDRVRGARGLEVSAGDPALRVVETRGWCLLGP